jgi:glycosyltransferase involved in cell wall biosynthesis
MKSSLRLALLTSDTREVMRDYSTSIQSFGTAPTSLLEGFSLIPNIEVHVISCLQQRVDSPEKLTEKIWFHALHVPKLGWMRTGFQGCIRAVRRKLSEIQPDIVHGQGTERDCALSAAFSGFPNVLTIHGNARSIAKINNAHPLSYWWFAARLELLALKRTQGVFCNSEFTKAEVQSAAAKVWLVPNALRLPFFDLPVKSLKSGPPLLLNIGVIQQRKQQLELLREAKKWQKSGGAFKLCFIGHLDLKSPYAEKFRKEIIELKNEGWVEHISEMNCQEIISALDQSAALIHVPKEEAFGLVVAEAIARGCRVFGFNVGGVSEICRGTGSIPLAKSNNWEELGKLLLTWLNQSNRTDEEGAMQMRTRYHPKVIAQRHLEIYKEVLGKT